jgi:putative ABC transport system permease protein
MSLLSAIRLAFSALLVHKGRSALTSLGIIIGIAAVIALVSAGDGAWLQLDERLVSAGKNLIIIRPGARKGVTVSDLVPLTARDADALRKGLGPLVTGVAPWQVSPRLASTRTHRWPTEVVGTTEDFRQVGNWQLVRGRFFDGRDVKQGARVCLLGQTVLQKLFPDRPDPVGAWVRLDSTAFQVIGVLGKKGSTPLGQDQDNQIFMPLESLQRHLVGKESLAMILTTARNEASIDQAKAEAVRILRQAHKLRPGVGDDFDVSSVRELAEFAVVLMTTLRILVAVIASISLVVGGIGIMNIMLVAVTERTREIGIRMAVGATPFDVLSQFLAEAVALALAGGILGVVLGIACAAGVAEFAGWPLVVSPAMVLLALLVTAAVGIFFGYYPALRASRLDPIVALRQE